uniref:Dynamin-like GTPase OPA1, mitochondrial n=1 Tax=Schistocephalus solidus TaxID=70667 RepID=A0A0X3P078_SCHSO
MAGILARIFRLRYILFGAGVGGAYTVNQKYEEFKNSLPSFGYLKNYLPQESEVQSLFTSIRESLFRTSDKSPTVNAEQHDSEESSVSPTDLNPGATAPTPEDVEKTRKESEKVMEELRKELIKTKLQYQKSIRELQSEIKSLRTQLLLRYQKTSQPDRIKKTLIEMYSEVLDELSSLDTEYNAQDHLPRVVVVGDQSSGKTSVLEMIAQARIFPRGSGEMMTRSPVKVTLSEGPYHVASFNDSTKEYDLTNENELASLRNEIELRMQALVANGKTISTEVISLSVKGPGLQRMVLVDLPGIISTQTTGMESGTRENIRELARKYMENPNAIILCIQDGSIDAERSNVTDLVTSVDPHGKRTIFVLTKVDLAEASLYNPSRIREILEGRLFPMKALGYYAVVTGRGTKDESIESIKEYEANFFKTSRLFREGALRLEQMTTENMSKAVSERFWRMVKDSVEQEADTYRAIRYNLETEWKNTYPHLREMDRDELFDKARNDILDNLVSLSKISTATWEKSIRDLLWKKLQVYVFEKIFEPSQQQTNLGAYQTMVDVLLRDWSQHELPNACVEAGWEVLYEQLEQAVKSAERSPGYDHIFDRLKRDVIQQTRSRHQWDSKATNRLRVIQNTTLEDHTVHTKAQWDAAVNFLEDALYARMKEVDQTISELRGPGVLARWFYWTSLTNEQKKRVATIDEILQIMASQQRPESEMSADDVTTVRRNLAGRKITVSNKFIRKTYAPLIQQLNLARAMSTCQYCRRSFYYYQQGFMGPLAEDPDAFSRIEDEAVGSGSLPSHDFLVGEEMALDAPAASMAAHSRRHDGKGQKLRTTTAANEGASTTVAAPAASNLAVVSAGSTTNTDYIDCREVVLFSRLLRMIEATSNSLRQQIVNDEIRRMEQLVKTVLNEISENPLTLNQLITGKRVQLAEDLKRTRHIQEKLEEFIAALNSSD